MSKMPFIPQERFFQSILYIDNELSGKENTYVPEEDDITLIYALKAVLLLDIGLTEQAEYAFEKSRACIMAKFDQVLKNITLTASSLFLGLYCAFNDDERSLLFFGNVKSFFERNSNIIETPSVLYLRRLYEQIIQVTIQPTHTDMEKNLKLMLHRERIFEEFKIQQQGETEESWGLTSEDMENILSDITQNTDLYQLVPERINYISEKLSQRNEKLVGKVPVEAIARFNLRTTLTLKAAVAQRCFRYGQIKEAIKEADSIAQATLLPNFSWNALHNGHIVTLAANIHLHAYCTSDDPVVRKDVLTSLQTELNALINIRNKNTVFGPSLDSIVERIQTMLRSAQEETVLAQLANQINSYQFGNTIQEVVLNSELDIESGIENDDQVDIIDKFFEDFM
jgi:hypothetical protein